MSYRKIIKHDPLFKANTNTNTNTKIGISVSRMHENSYSNNNYNDLNSLNFDIFRFKQENINILFDMFEKVLDYHQLDFNICTQNFIRIIEKGYLTVPYHNSTHAADVLHSSHLFIINFNKKYVNRLTGLDKFLVFLSASIHDFKHPGVNNKFLIDTHHKYALTYNDISVLENMHVSEALKITMNSKNKANIFKDYSNEKYYYMKKTIIDMVLSTDMNKHNDKLNSIKDNGDINKQDIMNITIHCADLSNTIRPFEIQRKWAELVTDEFLKQGDKEKNYGLETLFDRDNYDMKSKQVGFINFLVKPLFNVYCKSILNQKLGNEIINNLENNVKKWYII